MSSSLTPTKLNLPKSQLDAIKLVADGRWDAVLFTEKILGFELYDEQKLWLWITTKTQPEKCKELMMKLGRNFDRPEQFDQMFVTLYNKIRKHILCVANQIGKTFLTAIKHIWCNYYKVGLRLQANQIRFAEYKTLNASPHSDQARKCFTYIISILNGELLAYDPEKDQFHANELHPVMEGFLVGKNENEGEITFANNSQFYSKTLGHDKGTSRAGEQFGYISFDECAQSRHLEEEIAMLQSRTIRYGFCFDMISSPEVEKPSHQAYARLVKKGMKLQDNWYAMTDISLDKNKFINVEQKERAKEDLKSTNPIKYMQMIEGKFVSAGNKFFSFEEVFQVFSGPSEYMIYKRDFAEPKRKYLIGVDWGASDDGDKTWYVVLDWTDWYANKLYLVHHEFYQGGSPLMKAAALRVLMQNFGGFGQIDGEDNVIYHPVKLIMDTNSMGGIIMKKMVQDLKPIDFSSHGGQKDEMVGALYSTLSFDRKFHFDQKLGETIEQNPNFGKLRSYLIPELEEQLSNYKVNDDKIEQDAVMALGMPIWYLQKKFPTGKQMDEKHFLNPMSRYNSIKKR